RTEPGNNEQVKKHSTHYIAVSDAVKQYLIVDHQIPSTKISVVYEFLSTEHDPANQWLGIDEVRREIDLPPDALFVGGCGTTDWRKGVDLFLPLARSVHNQLGRSVHFVWVGGETNSPDFARLRHDMWHSGLADCVHFVGVKRNPLDYFALFDVLVLLS